MQGEEGWEELHRWTMMVGVDVPVLLWAAAGGISVWTHQGFRTLAACLISSDWLDEQVGM